MHCNTCESCFWSGSEIWSFLRSFRPKNRIEAVGPKLWNAMYDCTNVVIMNCDYDGPHGQKPTTYTDHQIWFVYNYTRSHSCDCNSDTRFIKTVNFDRNRGFLKFELENSCEQDFDECLVNVLDNSVVSGFLESGNIFIGFTISIEFDASCCH